MQWFKFLLWVFFCESVHCKFIIGRYKTTTANWTGGHAEFGRSSDDQVTNRQLFLSTFNPFSPGDTVFIAFMFIIPVTVGKWKKYSVGRSSLNTLEAVLDQEGQHLFNEMGHIDGNLILKHVWQEGMQTKYRSKRKQRSKDASMT